MRNMSRFLMIAVLLAVLGAAIGIAWVAEVDNYSIAPQAERRGGSCPVPSGDLRPQDRDRSAGMEAMHFDGPKIVS